MPHRFTTCFETATSIAGRLNSGLAAMTATALPYCGLVLLNV